MKKITLIFFSAILFLACWGAVWPGWCGGRLITSVYAQSTGNPLGNFPGTDLTFTDVVNILGGLTCWVTRIATPIIIIFLALAGLRFVMAGGNPRAFDQARRNLLYVLVGGLVIYGAYVIVATVANAVGITNFSFIPLVC